MRATAAVLGIATLGIVCYLLFWPVAVAPVAWDAPVDRGFVDPYAANDQLDRAQALELGPYSGPEDITGGVDGHLYITSEQGGILRVGARGDVSLFAQAGGRPLGIETAGDGSLVVANSFLGLQRITADGDVTTLLGTIDGRPLLYANDVALAADGRIFFTESSTRFPAADYGTFAASLLDINEHGGTGTVVEFDPASGNARTIMVGLNYANGIALSEDQGFLLVAETGSYRVLKHWLAGPHAGDTEVLLDNLPAFPDNINNGLNGRFWIGFVAPRNALLDRLSGTPFLRRVIQRLPTSLRPAAVPHSQVIAINGNGDVLMNLHDASVRYPQLTGVYETPDALYLTTLFGHRLPYVRKQNL